MSDPIETPASPPDADPVPGFEHTMESFQAMLDTNSESAARAIALQAMTNVLTLMLHNAVAQQQHAQILRTAFTTAAATAILNGRKSEAKQILDMAESQLAAPNFEGILEHIRSYLKLIDAASFPATS